MTAICSPAYALAFALFGERDVFANADRIVAAAEKAGVRIALEQSDAVMGEECERCAGNGEIITNEARYLEPHTGDKGDEAVRDCPDCDGSGRTPIAPVQDDDAEHRGWKIYFEPPPIPMRQFDYQSSDPNGDGEPNAYGRTLDECKADIDRILDERKDERLNRVCLMCGAKAGYECSLNCPEYPDDELADAMRGAILRLETIQETHPEIDLDHDLRRYRAILASVGTPVSQGKLEE